MDVFTAMKERFSVRKFEERRVPREEIGRVLQAALLAPTAKNLQPQRILVLDEAPSLEKLDRCTKCRFGAPAALLVCYDKDTPAGSATALTESRAARWTPPSSPRR